MSITELKLKLVNSRWDPNTLELGIRAHFRCEYCGCDFFASINDYDSIHRDHIIPVNAGGTDELDNLALCCKTCNYIKRNWNPTRELKDNSKREELLTLTKNYILKKRKDKEKIMHQVKELALQLMTEIKNELNNK